MGYVATLPTCKPPLIVPPRPKRSGPPRRQGLCSHLTHLWATSDSAPRSEAVGTPRRKGLFSHLAHLWATSDMPPPLTCPPLPNGGPQPCGRGYVATLPTCGPLLMLPPSRGSDGDPLGGKGYVATLPTCGPSLILAPAQKRRGTRRRQGLCSHLTHLWATSDAAPRSEAEGIPQAAGVM